MTSSQKTTSRRAALAVLAASLTIPRAVDAAGPDPVFAAIEKHREALRAMLVVEMGSPISDEEMQHYYDDESNALDEFAATSPTSLPGLLAMILYAEEVISRYPHGDDRTMAMPFDQGATIFESMAAAAKALMRAPI